MFFLEQLILELVNFTLLLLIFLVSLVLIAFCAFQKEPRHENIVWEGEGLSVRVY